MLTSPGGAAPDLGAVSDIALALVGSLADVYSEVWRYMQYLHVLQSLRASGKLVSVDDAVVAARLAALCFWPSSQHSISCW
jgi:hypothetical protein